MLYVKNTKLITCLLAHLLPSGMGLPYGTDLFRSELSLDTVPCWVLSEKRKKVEAFSCHTEGSICLKGSLE